MKLKWTKAMLKARIKMLELEVDEWKGKFQVQADLEVMARVRIAYVESKEFKNLKKEP